MSAALGTESTVGRMSTSSGAPRHCQPPLHGPAHGLIEVQINNEDIFPTNVGESLRFCVLLGSTYWDGVHTPLHPPI